MLKIIIGLIVAAYLAFSFVSCNRDGELQSQRATEQGHILADLEALHHPAVSRLVDDWRKSYPEPSEQRLTELRVLAERVKANPAGAEQYTAQAKQKRLDDLPFESPLGTPKAKPGI